MKSKLKIKNHKIGIILLLFLLPFSTHSQEIGSTLKTKPTLKDIFLFFANLISRAIIPLLFAAALVIFIWGVIQYMMAANDQTKREEGRKFILWGIISLFVMTAIWGILGILAGTFGGVNFAVPQLPQTR